MFDIYANVMEGKGDKYAWLSTTWEYVHNYFNRKHDQ